MNSQPPAGIYETSEPNEWKTCDQCPKKFSSTTRLTHHMKKYHSQRRPLKCKICDVYFKLESRLIHHRWKQHGCRKTKTEPDDENLSSRPNNVEYNRGTGRERSSIQRDFIISSDR